MRRAPGWKRLPSAKHCKLLHLPAVAAQCDPLAEQAARERRTHLGYLEALLQAEIEEREQRLVERRIREARLPRLKTLEEFNFFGNLPASPRNGLTSSPRWLYRAGRAHHLYRRQRHRQNPSAHGTGGGSVPAEAPGAIRYRGRVD